MREIIVHKVNYHFKQFMDVNIVRFSVKSGSTVGRADRENLTSFLEMHSVAYSFL